MTEQDPNAERAVDAEAADDEVVDEHPPTGAPSAAAEADVPRGADPGAAEVADVGEAEEAVADSFAAAAEGNPEVADALGTDDAAAAVEVDLELASMARERDEYLDALRRLQADFENYKKRMVRQQTETLERAGEDLVRELLPVLDAVDLARQHGAGQGVEQIAASLTEVLAKEGLERVAEPGEPFDPNLHEAVAHEEGDGGDQEIAEVMRAGYRWRGRLLRPAMVKVRG